MKEILLQYATYHKWANQLLLELIHTLPQEKQTQHVPSSFSSLHLTIVHLWDAESVWWQRMCLQEHVVFPSKNFSGNTKDASDQLIQMNNKWYEWLQQIQEHVLQHVFHYHNTKKQQFRQPVYQMLLHLFNHGTYHRGQLVNMLRQLGIEKIPQTDFIEWSRRR